MRAELVSQPVQGVARLPGSDFAVGLVACRVVARGMRPETVGDAFEQGGPLSCARLDGRALDRARYRERVIAVHGLARKTVGMCLDGETFRGRLAPGWDAQRALIVLAHEDHRSRPQAGEIQGA